MEVNKCLDCDEEPAFYYSRHFDKSGGDAILKCSCTSFSLEDIDKVETANLLYIVMSMPIISMDYELYCKRALMKLWDKKNREYEIRRVL